MTYKVFSDAANPSLWKVLITAKYNNVQVEQVVGGSAKGKSPLGKFPVLESTQGSIAGDNAIVRTIAKVNKGQLYGKDEWEAAQIESYLDLATNDIDLPASVWVYPILGLINNNVAATNEAKADIKKVLDYLNKTLITKTYLVGERITIADIVVALSLYHLFQKVFDNDFRKPYQNLTRWFTTLVHQPEFVAVLGETKLCDKAEVAKEGVIVAPKEEKKEEKKPEKKKEEKPKKVEKDEEEPEEDEFADKEDKKANPLDALPKSSMNFDEWKRVYSNAKDTRGEACSWFWKNLDKEGYSLWFCNYKYNNECEKVFMTCNLISGWIQRLDKLRKYAFGSLAIFGQEPTLEVQGVWLFRGQEPPQEMKETDDYEHYTWNKLNADDKATQELVNDFWAWDGSFGGNKQFNQGKIFK